MAEEQKGWETAMLEHSKEPFRVQGLLIVIEQSESNILVRSYMYEIVMVPGQNMMCLDLSQWEGNI